MDGFIKSSLRNLRKSKDRREEKMENKFYCPRMKLLSYLSDHGFKYVDVVPNLRNPNYFVWVYEKTPELMEAIANFYKEIN